MIVMKNESTFQLVYDTRLTSKKIISATCKRKNLVIFCMLNFLKVTCDRMEFERKFRISLKKKIENLTKKNLFSQQRHQKKSEQTTLRS